MFHIFEGRSRLVVGRADLRDLAFQLGIELLPLSVIEAARAGDAEAVERVLRYYEGYINKLCTRTLYDEYGQPHVCVDEYMKRRLEIKLISSIVTIP